jgi:hypothetical protein
LPEVMISFHRKSSSLDVVSICGFVGVVCNLA